MNKGQRRVQDVAERLLEVMSIHDIAQRAGLTTAEVEAAREGLADPGTVTALDNLGDEMDREYGTQNR